MENFESKWKSVGKILEERFGKVPDLEGILFLIGINELGMHPATKFTKEQKQDLMHIAICTLLSQLGYYQCIGRDEDGWLHFIDLKPIEKMPVPEQEKMLKECIVNYFEK